MQMGRVRVRQHVNPLASQYQQAAPTIDWASVYADPSLPLFVDMGCGPGRFLLLLARRHQEQQQQQQQQQQRMNYLGLEIRQPVSSLALTTASGSDRVRIAAAPPAMTQSVLDIGLAADPPACNAMLASHKKCCSVLHDRSAGTLPKATWPGVSGVAAAQSIVTALLTIHTNCCPLLSPPTLQLVERANKWAQETGVSDQVHYVFTNVSVSLARLLQAYPGPVSSLAAQFPDPHFKKRHQKRRMVQQSVVQAARELLVPGGEHQLAHWLAVCLRLATWVSPDVRYLCSAGLRKRCCLDGRLMGAGGTRSAGAWR
jgi:tRNA G46 methylase TrmB